MENCHLERKINYKKLNLKLKKRRRKKRFFWELMKRTNKF